LSLPLPDRQDRLGGGSSTAGAARFPVTAGCWPAGHVPLKGLVLRKPAMDAMNDDALLLVLERVDSHVSLIRAAAVCRRWRRAIADVAFLRCYRSLHAMPVTGYYLNHPSPWNLDGTTCHA
ncbi:unnamed protein product, partial [Urochloa humidicola]